MNLAYHFTSNKLRDGSPIPAIGEWIKIDANEYRIKCCSYGFHASRHPFDALKYAPGPLLHLVEMGDIFGEEEDKIVSDRRRIIKTIDSTGVLRDYVRRNYDIDRINFLEKLEVGETAFQKWIIFQAAAIDAVGCAAYADVHPSLWPGKAISDGWAKARAEFAEFIDREFDK